MTELFLDRLPSAELGTFGNLTMEDDLHQVMELCKTVENTQKLIPPGTYWMEEFNSPKNGACWLLKDVPHRSMIEMHPANLAEQLEGCIAPGDQFGILDGKPAVLNSKATMAMLRRVLPKGPIKLTIT